MFLGTSPASALSALNLLLNFGTIDSKDEAVFLVLPPGHVIIDPGTSQDLIGLTSYRRLAEHLKTQGLQPIKLVEKLSLASGVGGSAKSLFCSLVP